MSPTPHSNDSKNNPRIFLSYARKDGEEFARELHQRLTEPENPDEISFALWQDRTQMEGGKDWWNQITEALKTVEYMVLIMTEATLVSPIVKKEWRLARQEGVGVISVFGQSNLDLSTLLSPPLPEKVLFLVVRLPRWSNYCDWRTIWPRAYSPSRRG